jgi:hypothetical protein
MDLSSVFKQYESAIHQSLSLYARSHEFLLSGLQAELKKYRSDLEKIVSQNLTKESTKEVVTKEVDK